MQIGRLELYGLVSKSPLSKVAPELGISATALAAICKAHGVPYPGSGYWTRKSLGQTVVLEPLPSALDTEEKPIKIEPSEPRARRKQVRSKNTAAETSGSTEQIAPVSDTPMVKERLIEPHPIIAKWLVDHERRRQEAMASRNPWRIKAAPAPLSALDHRRHRILSALFHALEAKSAKISETGNGLLQATIDGEKIDFQIREKNRQVKISKEDKRSDYLSQKLVGTGRLVFAIRTYLRGPYNEEWLETDRNPLENQLPQIIDRLFEGARILAAWHVEMAEQQEQWRQEAAEEEERERLIEQEQNRRRKLGELARDWRTANQIRDLIAVIRAKPFESEKEVHGKSLAEWLAWAEAAADDLDINCDGVEGLFSIVGGVIC